MVHIKNIKGMATDRTRGGYVGLVTCAKDVQQLRAQNVLNDKQIRKEE